MYKSFHDSWFESILNWFGQYIRALKNVKRDAQTVTAVIISILTRITSWILPGPLLPWQPTFTLACIRVVYVNKFIAGRTWKYILNMQSDSYLVGLPVMSSDNFFDVNMSCCELKDYPSIFIHTMIWVYSNIVSGFNQIFPKFACLSTILRY